jgi:hypothetical protein
MVREAGTDIIQTRQTRARAKSSRRSEKNMPLPWLI